MATATLTRTPLTHTPRSDVPEPDTSVRPGTRSARADRAVTDLTRPADRRQADRRPPVARPSVARPSRARVRGTRCATPAGGRTTGTSSVYLRRRLAAAALLVGVGLAVLVWVIAIIGSDYAASVTPEPIGTEVVHVRQGDSLTSIAERVAPDVPAQAVIDAIVERNDLSGAGLHVGQALVAPAYR